MASATIHRMTTPIHDPDDLAEIHPGATRLGDRVALVCGLIVAGLALLWATGLVRP